MRGIKRKLLAALETVNQEIAANTDQSCLFSRGLASEGYAGGYAAALRDVLAALNGTENSSRYWKG